MTEHPPKSGASPPATPALEVFALRDSLVDEYRRFETSFTTIHAHDVCEQVEAIYAEDRYLPDPLIEINPSYKRSTDVDTLVANGVLSQGCAHILRAEGKPLSLYKHQEQAVALAAADESFVVTTGTGSGKSLCFFIPIVDHVLKARRTTSQRRTHAIVVYPMRAPLRTRTASSRAWLRGSSGPASWRATYLTEPLERITDSTATAGSVQPHLGPAIDAGVPVHVPDSTLCEHPLSLSGWRRTWASRSLNSTSVGSGPGPKR